MHLKNASLKQFALFFTLACASGLGASAQNIVDTAARPKVFAQGVASTPNDEWATSFMPDGKTVFFSQGGMYWTICYAKMVDGQWAKPNVINFSGKWNDTDPFVSPDGGRMFFISNRPVDTAANQSKYSKNYHIWYSDHLSGDKWSEPRHLDAPVNINGSNNYAPSVSSSGTLCFCSRGREGHDGMASYYAKWLGDHYDTPKQFMINGKEDMQDPFIAPDESYLVFLSGNDILISYHHGSGWSAPEKLGPQVNSGDSNSSPYVSRDGKMLYYTSTRVKGFYKRDLKGPALNYDGLVSEMNTIFNGRGNILVIPVNIPGNLN